MRERERWEKGGKGRGDGSWIGRDGEGRPALSWRLVRWSCSREGVRGLGRLVADAEEPQKQGGQREGLGGGDSLKLLLVAGVRETR